MVEAVTIIYIMTIMLKYMLPSTAAITEENTSLHL